MMSVKDRLDDISNISGYSNDIVSAILKASMKSLIKSIRVGERASLPGICTFEPNETVQASKTSDIGKRVKVKVNPSKSLVSSLKDLDDFEYGLDSEIPEVKNIEVSQLSILE